MKKKTVTRKRRSIATATDLTSYRCDVWRNTLSQLLTRTSGVRLNQLAGSLECLPVSSAVQGANEALAAFDKAFGEAK